MEASKTCQDTDIPTKIIKDNANIFVDILLTSFNDFVEKSNFLSSIKRANITPVFKKRVRNSKGNYRLVSKLPSMSKIFERYIFRHLYSFILEFLSKYKIQHCLLVILEQWKSTVEKGK